MKKQMYEPDPISLPAEFPQSFRDLFQNDRTKSTSDDKLLSVMVIHLPKS